MKKILLIAALAATGIEAQAQKDNKTVQLPGGVSYTMLLDVPGEPKPRFGDYVETHMYVDVDGDRLYSSRETGGQPIGFLLQKPTTPTDVQYVITQMTAGDSVAIVMSVDSMLKAGGPVESWMKPNTGQTATYTVKLLKVKPLDRKGETPPPGKE